MANPCFCGCSLKTGTLIFAIIEMVVAAILFFGFLIFGGFVIGGAVGAANESEDKETWGAGIGVLIAIILVVLIVLAFKFYLGLTLKRGADQEDLRKCRIWFIVSAVLFGFSICGLVRNIAIGQDAAHLLATFLGLGYEAFAMWVVYEFMNELKSGRTFDTSYNNAGGVLKV